MRVTQGMLTQQFLFNLSNINQSLSTDQREASTGKVLNQPADNPLALTEDMDVRTTLAQTHAYQGVISSGLTLMDNTTSSVQGVVSTLQAIQTNVNAAISTTDGNASSLNALLQTTQQLVDEVYSSMNATLNNNYIFSGSELNQSAQSIASGDLLQTGPSTAVYDSAGSGSGEGATQTVPRQAIASQLDDPNGVIMPGTSYKMVINATSVASDGSIDAGTVQVESQDGSTVLASGTIPPGTTAGSSFTFDDGSGITLTLGNLYQVSQSAASGAAPVSYQQTDVITPADGTSDSINYEVSQDVNIPVNLTAAGLFHTVARGATEDLHSTLNSVQEHLAAAMAAVTNGSDSDYQSAITNLQTDLTNLQANSNQVVDMNAELGTRIQRMQAVQNQMASYTQSLTNEQSNIEDADMATVLTQYSTDQAVYQAALQIGVKVLLPTLTDYLPNG